MTLVEVALALAMLLGGALATVSLIDRGAHASAAAALHDEATRLAADAMERLRAAPYGSVGIDPADPGFVDAFESAPTVQLTDSRFPAVEVVRRGGRELRIARHVTWASVRPSSGGEVSRAYKLLSVEVSWERGGRRWSTRLAGAIAPDVAPRRCERRWRSAGGVVDRPVNAYLPGAGAVPAGSTVVPVGDLVDETGRGVRPGDQLVILQMAGEHAGRYEYALAASELHGGFLAVTGRGTGAGLVSSYGPTGFQVVVLPTMEWAELRPGVRATPWNGTTGGVLALDVTGDLTVSGEVDLSGGGGGSGPWAAGASLAVDSLLPGDAAPSGGVGGPLVLLRTGSIAGGALLADAPKPDGRGGTFLVTAERGDLSTLVLAARGAGAGAGGRAFTTAEPRGGTLAATVIDPAAVPGLPLGSGCTPAVTTWVRATTRAVPADGSTPADVVVEVRNEADGPDADAEVTLVLPSGLTYASTVGVSLRDGAAWSEARRPATGTATPVWGAFSLPPGSSVAIDLLVVAAPGTPPGVAELSASTGVVSTGGFSRSTYAPQFGTDDDIEVGP